MASIMPLQNMPQKAGSGAIPATGYQAPVAQPVSGAIPVTGNPVATAQANPFAAPTATTAAPGALPASGTTAAPVGSVPTTATGTPTSGALPAGTSQSNGINWNDGAYTVTGDFKDTYGAGTGTAITDVLSGLGTATDSAVQATIANTNLAASKEYGNIQASEAAGGVTPNSSTAALASGDFYSSVNSQLQQTVSGMELNEENILLSTLTNEGDKHGPDQSGFDSFLNGLTDVGEIGSSILGGIGGISTGGLSSLFGKGGSTDTDNSGTLADIG